MKMTLKCGFFLFITAYFLTTPLAYAENAADDNTGRDDPKIFQVYDDINLVPTIKFFYGKPKIFVKAVFPQLQSEEDADDLIPFNNKIISIVQEENNAFQHQVQLLQTVQKRIQRVNIKNDMYLDYDTSAIKSHEDHLISIRFSIQGYIAGMAHPYHFHRVLNYNLDTNAVIELSDLFQPDSNYLDVIADYTSNTLMRRLEDKSLIANGTAPRPENFKNWNIKPTGLLITFDEAQVAAYVQGAQSVLIPYAVLRTIIAPNSPIAWCAKHRSRCLSEKLVTGGFIDEAINSKHSALDPVLSSG